MREMPAGCKALLIALFVIALDVCTKYFVVSNLAICDVVNCCSIFNIVHVENHGVAFGVLSSVHRFVLIALAVAILIAFVIWVRQHAQFWLPGGLVIGGAIGNLLDRSIRGVVIDFLDFHLKNYHWPAFNVADSAIVIAVGILLFWREEK